MAVKKTVFDRLNSMFDDGVSLNKIQTNRYEVNKDVFTTTDKSEFEAQLKQAHQQKYLSSTWAKIDNELYQQALHYELTRIGSYSDFEAMELYPEIAAALDIYMEESVTTNAKGDIINIFSESDRVRKILDDLFHNRLNIRTNLPMWARNLAKYGDNFLYLNIDANNGIMGVKQMPNFEMERKEGDLHGTIGRLNNISPADTENSDKLTYIWKKNDMQFKPWQITHFRLLGDDRQLPYGTSLLEKARRIWKQLVLSEDAMLVYRVTRAPERRVYKIYVGNIDDADVGAYVNEIANRFKRKPVFDPQTGQIDVKYNQMAQDQDFFIPVRDENAPNPIDTLQGASNLDQIADIEYLQNKLFAALRIPKPFLGFDETTGDGKNLALQDIRFSRTINRLQQALIHGLNQIAIIHLNALDFGDEIENFAITLNNPSTQAEMLKIEQLQSKVNVYQSAVGDAGNGFGAMSMNRAKKEILGMSDDDIKEDLLQQRIEKAAAAELEKTSEIIKRTGVFDTVDNIYGEPGAEYSEGGPEGEGGGGDAAGGFGGGDFGDADFGDAEFDEEGGEDFGEGGEDLEFGEEDITDAEGDFDIPEDAGEDFGETNEAKKDDVNKLITEKKEVLKQDLEAKKEKYTKSYFNRLVEKEIKQDEKYGTPIYDKDSIMTESFKNMLDTLDDLPE